MTSEGGAMSAGGLHPSGRAKMAAVAAISIVLIIISVGMAFYGFNLEQVEGQVFLVPWGLDVVGYTFFALTSTGSSIVNSIYTIFGYKGPNGEYEKMIKYGVWFSLATIFPAWLLVLLSLAKPFDFAYILMFFRPSSRIAWMALLYTIFALSLLIELLYMLRADASERIRKAKWAELTIAILVLSATVAVHTNLGEVFGSLIAVPGWYGPWLALYFILSAVMLGAAGQMMFVLASMPHDSGIRNFFARYYSAIFMVMIPTYILDFTWIVIAGWYNKAVVWPIYQDQLFGADAPTFWILELLIGLLLPLALAIASYRTRRVSYSVAAALFMLIGGFASKYSLIILPQEFRPYQFLTLQLANVTYSPPLGLVIMFTAAVLLWPAVYALGTVILPLEEGRKPKHIWFFK
ncbi:MAG: NrfD/PsrC family molybdoenzyme membrane anchor subunit [Conexivisphaera sp.]